jgi:hypothetical protein
MAEACDRPERGGLWIEVAEPSATGRCLALVNG